MTTAPGAPWHIRIVGMGARAFVRPRNALQQVCLFVRGWRPFYLGGWWSKSHD